MGDSQLTIHVEEKGTVMVIHLKGSLDANTTPELDATVKKYVASGKTKIVFDMKELVFISSAGLGMLSALRKTTRASGGDVRISRPRPEVVDVFELLSFSKLFQIDHNLEDSLKGL